MAVIQTLTAEELESKVLQARGPVALDFYQGSCPPCHVLEPKLKRVARGYKGRVAVYRVDIDRDMPVAQRSGVMSIPTVLIFHGGKEIARLDGLITEADIREAFERALSESSA